jgi:hypothetical protein
MTYLTQLYALILDNAVIALDPIDPTGRYHDSIGFVDITSHPQRSDIDVDWIAVTSDLEPGYVLLPSDLPAYLSKKRQNALQLIANAHAEMLTAATGGATSAERDTWIVKEREALAVIAGATTSDALIPVGDETLLGLAQKIAGIEGKATAYRRLVGIADHIKRSAEKAVEALALETLDDLSALDAVLADAKAMADGALQQIAAQ